MWVERRKHDRLRPLGAVPIAADRYRRDVLDLPRCRVQPRHFVPARAKNYLWIGRIRRNVSIFDHSCRVPIPMRDLSIISAACNAHGPALLLPATDFVRKFVRSRHVVELGGRLVVPGAPSLAAIHGDDRALVCDQQDNVGVVRIDPQVLIIISARRTADAFPRLATIARFHRHDAGAVDDVWVFRIYLDHREIAAADLHRRPSVFCDLAPAFAAVIRTVKAQSFAGSIGTLLGR